MLFPTSEVLILSSMVGTLACAALLFVLLHEPTSIRFTGLLSLSLLLGYAGGSLSTWLQASGFDDFTVLVGGRPWEQLSDALAVVFACCGAILALGRLELPCIQPSDLRDSFGFGTLLGTIGILIITAAYITGDLGLQGVQPDDRTRNVSVVGVMAQLVAAPLLGLLGYMIGKTTRWGPWVSLWVMALFILIGTLPTGRRSLILAFLMLVIGFALSGRLRRWTLIRKGLVTLLLILLSYIGTTYFYAMRLASYELGSTSPLLDQMALAAEFMTSPTLNERLGVLISDNLRTRAFMLGYLSDLLQATQSVSPLYGDGLLFYLQFSLPSALSPAKDQILAIGSIEQFAHPKLGLPVIDQANTVLTDGVIDFGISGSILYLLGLIVLLAGANRVLQRFSGPVSGLFVKLVLVHLALIPELGLFEYFTTLRNLCLLSIILFTGEKAIWIVGVRKTRSSQLGPTRGGAMNKSNDLAG